MAVTNSDVLAVQMEQVRPFLQELYQTNDGLLKLIQKSAEDHRVSALTWSLSNSTTVQAFRIPVKLYRGGDYGTFSYDGGDLGRGSSLKTAYMTSGYFPTKFGVELTGLEMEATATSEQATTNAFKDMMENSMTEMQCLDNIGLHTDGTGVLATGNATGSPAGSNPTYNLEPNFGPNRVRYNQPVDVLSNDLTTKKNAATVRVTSFDPVAKTVTLAGTVTSPANDDKIAFQGMAVTVAVGSWKNGIYTFNNSTTSGSLLGLSRTTAPEIVTPTVSAASANLVPAHPLLLSDYIRRRRDAKSLKGLIGIASPAQRSAWYFSGIAISEWQRSDSNKMPDLIPDDITFEDKFQMAGVTHIISQYQDNSRIDWIVPKNFGRTFLHKMKYYEVAGNRIFPLYGTSGGVATGIVFYLVATDNWFNVDPGAAGTISSLALPSGY